jgi:hypothetical protein
MGRFRRAEDTGEGVGEMSGTMNSLAVWFQEPIKADGPEDDYVRDDVLNEVTDYVWWARSSPMVNGKAQYAVLTRGGRCLIDRGERLVEFTWNRHSETVIYSFWMNLYSVMDIFEKFKKDPVNEAKYDDIFTGVRT